MRLVCKTGVQLLDEATLRALRDDTLLVKLGKYAQVAAIEQAELRLVVREVDVLVWQRKRGEGMASAEIFGQVSQGSKSDDDGTGPGGRYIRVMPSLSYSSCLSLTSASMNCP